MDNILITRLKQRLAETGLSMREVSLAATGTTDTVRNILRGATQQPKAETLERIAAELGVTAGWLLGHESAGAAAPAAAQKRPASRRGELRPAPVSLPPRADMPNDVPVKGTAAGSHLRGAFQIDTDTIVDYVRRPPALSGARHAYALFVEGTSMEPRYFSGDLVFVHPDRPPRMGDPVVVQCQNGPHEPMEATIGFLRRRTERAVVIAKLNPAAEVEILRVTVAAIHKVMTVNELFGV